MYHKVTVYINKKRAAYYKLTLYFINSDIMSSKSERLNMLVAYFANGNKAEFARSLSISPQNLNSWLRNEFIDYEKVYSAHPSVSAEWLLSGEGEMLAEKRPLATLKDDKLIPVVHEENLLLGNWEESESFILVRGDNHLKYDFITIMPNGDLDRFIYTKSILGCDIVDANNLRKDCLYIIRTKSQGVFFVQYLGDDTNVGQPVHKFTTQRGQNSPEIQLALPSNDIVQCAEIVDYSVNHYVEHVI